MPTKKKAASVPDEVEITLAHPWTYQNQNYGVEDSVTVPTGLAQSLIGAGYVKDVDPDDPAAVTEALGLTAPPAGISVEPGPTGLSV